MRERLLHWLHPLLPAAAALTPQARWRAVVGALLGIALTGWLTGWWLAGQPTGLAMPAFWLVAPMGASAVLLFAVPASPLAQPWSLLGGNVVSALIGVSCVKLMPVPALAAGLAVGLAIGAMLVLRCVHPPGGAVALTAVVGGPAVHQLGYGFVLMPVLLNTALLLLAALLVHRFSGQRYPHRQQAEARPPGALHDTPTQRLGFTPDDLDVVLKRYDQVLDISRDDLEDLFRQTEMQAYRRRFGETTCGSVMSPDPVAVVFGTELAEAWRLMHRHRLHALPVIDRARRVVGIVTRADFLAHAGQDDMQGLGERLRHLLSRVPHTHSAKPEVVGQIMSAPATTVGTATPLVELVPLMADEGLHHVPVVDEERRLAGMVTQSDLVAALYETSLARLDQPRRLP
ncbi:MAG: HPP family protein [Rubrivivax sp.]|nr:MAG: HPP family protein [Rubrivivax sp.]